MSAYSDEYKEYTMGLALLDIMPVLLFLASGLIMYSMYGSPLLLAGVLACFMGGLCKAIWKMIVVVSEKDFSGLTRMFHILMPAGFVLMILSVFAGGKAAFSGLWRSLTMMPASILFVAGFVLMCIMGYLGSHMDNSARSNWIEELVNTLAQLAILAGVIAVYFGTFYHADVTALAALESTEDVSVHEIIKEDDAANGWFFDGPGTDSALVFYPGAKVEAAAYAPLMKELSFRGVDCYLCKMPLNFALLGKDTAEEAGYRRHQLSALILTEKFCHIRPGQFHKEERGHCHNERCPKDAAENGLEPCLLPCPMTITQGRLQ